MMNTTKKDFESSKDLVKNNYFSENFEKLSNDEEDSKNSDSLKEETSNNRLRKTSIKDKVNINSLNLKDVKDEEFYNDPSKL